MDVSGHVSINLLRPDIVIVGYRPCNAVDMHNKIFASRAKMHTIPSHDPHPPGTPTSQNYRVPTPLPLPTQTDALPLMILPTPHPIPSPLTTTLLPPPPPLQRAQRTARAKSPEREPDERGIRLRLPAPVPQVDGRADLAGVVDAAVDDDVVDGVGGAGAGVGAEFGGVGLGGRR